MNDPIKDFVERNRAEFDHLEAPAFKLDQLRPQEQDIPGLRKRRFSILDGNKWLVAASVLITLTCAWFFFSPKTGKKPEVQLAGQHTPHNPERVVAADSEKVKVTPLSEVSPLNQQVKKAEPKIKTKKACNCHR
jgi:hypothetical protein